MKCSHALNRNVKLPHNHLPTGTLLIINYFDIVIFVKKRILARRWILYRSGLSTGRISYWRCYLVYFSWCVLSLHFCHKGWYPEFYGPSILSQHIFLHVVCFSGGFSTSQKKGIYFLAGLVTILCELEPQCKHSKRHARIIFFADFGRVFCMLSFWDQFAM